MSARWKAWCWAVAVMCVRSPAGAQATDPMTGLWGFEYHPSASASGEVLLTQAGRRWTLRIAGFETNADQSGDSVRLALPGDRGILRIRLPGTTGGSPHAMWIQPAGTSAPYASPVRLSPAGPLAWRGVVQPVDDRFSLYLALRRDSAGMLIGSFQNPEANFGGGRLFRVAREPGQLVLIDAITGKRRFSQAFDSVTRTISFDFGTPLTATSRTMDDAVGFTPRSPMADRYAYRPPLNLHDGWTIAHATETGLNVDTLTAMVRRVMMTDPVAGAAPRIHSVVVARHGQLVLDEYFYGYSADRLHDLRSASKTVTSIMLGVAMRHGAAINPETKITPGGATIGNLLTHTSGLACDDNDDNSPGNEDVMQAQQTEHDWYRYALALPQKHAPGTTYAYCSAGINLVGQAIGRAERRWLPEFFDVELAQPLGIEHYGMNLMPTGEGYSAGGMHVRPRDLLKFGQLYLDGGVWRGQRLIDRAWVERSTRRQQPDTAGADDGFAWHRHVLRVRGRDVQTYEASGNGGQFLLVAPELDLVVVVTAGNYQQGRVWLSIRDQFITRYVLGAVVR